MKSNGVIESRNVATEACRQANNVTKFLGRVKLETGLHLETISPCEEAQLTLEGCINLINSQIPYAVIFDIGGGSTEIMWVRVRKDGSPQMIDTLSIPLGVVSLCEKFGSTAIGQTIFSEIGSHFIDALDAFDEQNKISQYIKNNQVQMLGTSGTVTTLGAIYLNLPRYDRSKIDGLNLGCEKIFSIITQLANMDCLARAEHPCIGKGRAELIVMGCAVLSTIFKRWPLGTIKVADRGIREGLLNRMINQNK
jgi:exopolyphosphatase/guanosine-5'-triphosphate,3'-diphosphate pyrophosphatase